MRIYTVSLTGPFTIKVDGKELFPSGKTERVTLKTSFIRIDQKLNIYSYSNDAVKEEIIIYKNNKLIKTGKGKFRGIRIIQADEVGNWAGYIINKDGTAIIIQNAKQVKLQKIGKGEEIIGITKESDVITTVFDSALSQVTIRKNGVPAKQIKMPEGTIGIQVVRMMAWNPFDFSSLYVVLPNGIRPRIPGTGNGCPPDHIKEPFCVATCDGNSTCIENCPCIRHDVSVAGSVGGTDFIPTDF